MAFLKKYNISGYTLVELLVVVIILAILSSVAMKGLKGANDVARFEETRIKLDQLAFAIAGDPSVLAGGKRANYGYIGDVGALPPDLDALVQNPGGYSTWHGPYIRDPFTSGSGNNYFKQDAWGKQISYSGGNTLSSTGGGTSLTRKISEAVVDLTINTVTVVVTDIDKTPPGTSYKDSVRCILTFPNGSGSTTSRTKYPNRSGLTQFDSIPIGQQDLKIVYLPTHDTLNQKVAVDPKQDAYIEISLYRSVW
jgi:prepilin-type N-terminal cleavage/methylation domain-containing protein